MLALYDTPAAASFLPSSLAIGILARMIPISSDTAASTVSVVISRSSSKLGFVSPPPQEESIATVAIAVMILVVVNMFLFFMCDKYINKLIELIMLNK